jgi:glutamate-1-semialdehyde aminotransferase
MAVRVARAVVGNGIVISIGYHGSSVIFAHPPQNAGIPSGLMELTSHVAFGDDAGLIAALQDPRGVAAVIVEVPSTDERAADFLNLIRRMTTKAGALFILDDIVTGFRLALGGAAEHYGVNPDLACYGKAMSNGRGISALVGPAEYMRFAEDRAFYSNTFNGDPFNCGEVIATLAHLEKNKESVYAHLWDMGEQFKLRMNAIGVPVVGHAPRSAIVFPDEKVKAEFSRRMILHGIVCDRPNYMSTAHRQEHLDATVAAAQEVMWSLRRDGLC